MIITASQWLVLDNLKHEWPYSTNIRDRDQADKAYRQCVENGWIRDGEITDAGRTVLLANRIYETRV